MRVLFIGGVFDESHYPEIIHKTKKGVEFAANTFQKKLLAGLKANSVSPLVISAPFIGAYPSDYTESIFKGFEHKDNSGYWYCHFLNVFGIRNLSRLRNVKRAIDSFVMDNDEEKYIIVYSPHTPFLQAANYAKKKDSKIKICLVVPDLPQYMNLNQNIPWYYSFLKKWDIKVFMKESKTVDSFVLLTKQMKDKLDIGSRPYIVVEGIASEKPCEQTEYLSDPKTIVYAGKLNYSFGITTLLEAFSRIPGSNVHLIICGAGEAGRDIEIASREDSRIEYKGLVSPSQALSYMKSATVLVNPRQNNSDYTRYSFPSKIMDYLSTGKPVVSYYLDGMPEYYSSFLYCPEDNTPDALCHQLELALDESSISAAIRIKKYCEYYDTDISEVAVGRRIINLLLD